MTKKQHYLAASREIAIRLENGGELYADLGNVAAVLKKRFAIFSWIGFYLFRNSRLILGPFQGPPACVTLELNQGVCGSCAAELRSIIVPDVHQFSGHVACDPNSKSEIVIPCFNDENQLAAVLDVDSDQFDAFDEVDQINLEHLCERLRPIWRPSRYD
jgi:L-methionine (R)-S-oxide reductase